MSLPAIHLRDIPDDGLTVDAPLDGAWLGLDHADSGYSPVDARKATAHVRHEKHGRDVTLTGTVDAPVQAPCVRCLEPVALDVHADFALHLEPKPAKSPHAPHEELDLKADELDADYYENDTIDLDRWVREQVLLEVPTHPSCPEPCVHPIVAPREERAHGEIDPRLAPLKHFLKH
jgi:uncharacterized protein